MTIIPIFLDISGGEFLIIFLAVFLVFGPKKIPEIARQIGKTMNELKKTTSDLTREFNESTEQVKREVGNMKSGLLEEPLKIKEQFTNLSVEANHEANQLANSVNRGVQPDLAARNQAEMSQHPRQTKPESDPSKSSAGEIDDPFTPTI